MRSICLCLVGSRLIGKSYPSKSATLLSEQQMKSYDKTYKYSLHPLHIITLLYSCIFFSISTLFLCKYIKQNVRNNNHLTEKSDLCQEENRLDIDAAVVLVTTSTACAFG